jgi:hypothetical protein
LYKTISRECKSVDFPAVVVVWRKWLLKIMRVTNLRIYNANETGLFFRFAFNKALSFKGDPCNGGKNSREQISSPVSLKC